jgi:4-diphosphocytidyl-2-C-methyl-D-erythritol kinase
VRPARVRIAAAAKVNLWLRVFGRDARGYHAIESLFQLLDLADGITVERGPPGVRLVGAPPELGPEDHNLAVRAARWFMAAARTEGGITITMDKRIPWGAGLGGGSSDAAATLTALNRLFDDPLTAGDLLEIGSGLGSDVPFFLSGAALALGWGRGERLLPLPSLPARPALIVPPPSPVGTADAYAWLDKDRGAADTGERAAVIPPSSLGAWEEVRRLAHNDFEPAVAARLPEIGHWLDRLRTTAAFLVTLAGSGGAIVALYQTDAQRDVAWQALGGNPAIVRCETLAHAPAPSVD